MLPPLLHPSILSHATKSGDLMIQSDDSRKQADNANACFRKLHEFILAAGREVVPGETSEEQREKVENLQKAEAAGRRRLKERQSQKKSARRGSKGDD